jgi:hypothetical protein
MSDLLNKPIVLFLLGALLAFSGSYVTGQQSASSLTVRVATLEERAKQPVVTPAELARVEAAARDAQRTYVTKDEFQQFSSSMLRGIEELRIELRERRTR